MCLIQTCLREFVRQMFQLCAIVQLRLLAVLFGLIFLIQVNYTSQHWIEPIPTGKIKRNNKFAAFWCVFLTKIKVDSLH